MRKMIPFMGNEDLCLVLEPAKGRGMDDAVAVALEGCARAAFGLRHQPAARARGIGRIGRAGPVAETDVAQHCLVSCQCRRARPAC